MQQVIDAIENPEYSYVQRLRRYRNKKTGRFVSKGAIADLTEQRIANLQQDMRTVGDLLLDGKLSLRGWQSQMAESIKTLHIQQYLLGVGGEANIRKEDYLEIARELKSQYGYLRNFAYDLTQGKMTSAQFKNRAGMYASAAKVSYFRGERVAAQRAGLTFARRLLTPGHMHCTQCPQYQARGIVPISEVVMPTVACDCMFNCKCRVEYFASRAEFPQITNT